MNYEKISIEQKQTDGVGLAEAQLLDEDNNTIQKMIFSFSQPVWNDMLRGVMVMQSEQDYIILEFDYEHSRLPRPSQQRSVLIKDVVLPVVNIKRYSKKTWMKDHTSAGDYSAIHNFLKNRNNHTTSDWNCIGVRVVPMIQKENEYRKKRRVMAYALIM